MALVESCAKVTSIRFAVQAYAAAAKAADIVIAEVGTWSNPLSPDEAKRKAALEKCKKGLALADEIGARCCVNITGSLGLKWHLHRQFQGLSATSGRVWFARCFPRYPRHEDAVLRPESRKASFRQRPCCEILALPGGSCLHCDILWKRR